MGRSAVVATVLLLGCAPAPPPRSTSVVPVASTPAPVTSAVAPAVSPAPLLEAGVTSLPERTPMPFCLVARPPWSASLLRLQDETLLVIADRPVFTCDRAGFCAPVPDQ